MAQDPNNSLPGDTPFGGSLEGTRYIRVGNFTAVQKFEPFLVRGTNFVQHVKSQGWLVQTPEGNFFGVEDADFANLFDILQHTITTSAGANGTIGPGPGAVSADDGEEFFLIVITPDALYTVDELLVDGVPATPVFVGPHYEYVFPDPITEDHTVSVTFVLI